MPRFSWLGEGRRNSRNREGGLKISSTESSILSCSRVGLRVFLQHMLWSGPGHSYFRQACQQVSAAQHILDWTTPNEMQHIRLTSPDGWDGLADGRDALARGQAILAAPLLAEARLIGWRMAQTGFTGQTSILRRDGLSWRPRDSSVCRAVVCGGHQHQWHVGDNHPKAAMCLVAWSIRGRAGTRAGRRAQGDT